MKKIVVYIACMLLAPSILISLTQEELDIYEIIIRSCFDVSNSGDSVYAEIGLRNGSNPIPSDLQAEVSDLGLVWISSDDGDHYLLLGDVLNNGTDRRVVLCKHGIGSRNVSLIKVNGIWQLDESIPFFP